MAQKVYDVITVLNEMDLLELRLEMYNDIVDYFVIIECVETFSGKPKPLYFEENKERFKKYEDKIIHHITYNPPKSYDDLRQRILNPKSDTLEKQICIQALTSTNVPPGELHWLKEFYQKENIRRALEIISDPKAICFIGDLDEFWNPELIEEYKLKCVENYSTVFKLKQLAYSSFLNNRSNESWAGTLLTNYINIFNSCLNHLRTPSKTQYEYLENSGLHFSFIGGTEQIKLKIDSYGHQEYNNNDVTSKISERLEKNQDVLGRNQFNFWLDESDLPKYLIQNKEKYKQYFK